MSFFVVEVGKSYHSDLHSVHISYVSPSILLSFHSLRSGKSTVLNLLMRFREPKEGSITWDGSNVFGSSLSSFREQVSVMFQKTMIYQTTIRDNITFGLPEREGGVEEAAKGAEIHDSIVMLPEGYDTKIGGDSIAGMSGGQLQRICLARALYRQPSVLLLDEGKCI